MSIHHSEGAVEARFSGRSLSMSQACAALGVSRRTLYYWIKDGRLRTVRTSMGSQRVLVDSLDAVWMERPSLLSDSGLDAIDLDACGGPPTEG